MGKKDRKDKSTIPQNNTSSSGASNAILVTKICAASVKLIRKNKAFPYSIMIERIIRYFLDELLQCVS